jgi:hypothetical protein
MQARARRDQVTHQAGKFYANKGTKELISEIVGASPNLEPPHGIRSEVRAKPATTP